jgi:hypothetical protein
MIGLILVLSAQAAVATPSDTSPPASPPARKVCRKAPGSYTIVCRPSSQQQSSYRLPKYGPAAPSAQPSSGNGVKVRAQASNRGTARRNRPTATVGIPF